MPLMACVTMVMLCGLLAFMASPAQAQFRDLYYSAPRLQTGQQTNLFAGWSGDAPFHGVLVMLPADWQLKHVRALRYGYEQVPLRVRRIEEGQYRVEAAQVMRGAHEFVFQVETGHMPGTAEWSLVPFVAEQEMETLPALQVSKQVYLEEEEVASENRVLAFSGSAAEDEQHSAPLFLQPAALPKLDLKAPFTIAFWMKTVRLSEVVISTWDGDERAAYPFEFVVGPAGRLIYYRGRPGEHQSMATPRPVADGTWHHLALTNDPEQGWARLYLDGRCIDSLYSAVMPAVDLQGAVAVGGRLPGRTGSAALLGRYGGLLDELSFWPQARAEKHLRAGMQVPVWHTDDQVVHLGFEQPLPDDVVVHSGDRLQRVTSDLSFYRPLRNLQATAEEQDVLLTWEAPDEDVAAFVIERSVDGRTFETVDRVSADEAVQNTFDYYDREVPGQVLYYRIRQVFKSKADRVSGMIKVGLGMAPPADVVLIGNFPNPFRTATTVTYEVHTAQHVRVSVWDLSGQQVALLVDEVQGPGSYEARFQAPDLPSGTYFVHLRTPHRVESHKILLMK